MRWGLLLYFFITVFDLISQDSYPPASGVYNSDFAIQPAGTAKWYYSSSGTVNPESFKGIKDSLVISKTTSLLFKIKKTDGKDTLLHRSYHFEYQSKLPILSLAIDPESLWNDSTGIYVKGKYAYWSDSTGHWENCNYQKKWERPTFATFIDTNGSIGFSQYCGMKLFGESTRRQGDKSFKIIARDSYGDDDFSYPIFPHKEIKKFKQLAVRTSGNDFMGSRFKDLVSANLVSKIDLDYMDYLPIRLFVNGEDWGVYNLREKINEYFIAANHKVDKDSVNIIMGKWIRQEGNSKQYMKMYHWFEELDTMDTKAYETAKSFLNIRNYINFRVFQIYINNKDSRGNIRYYNINGTDLRFRMIVYDTDLGYGKYSFNYLEKCLSTTPTDWFNPEWSTMYLTKLMQNPEFKNEFATQFAHLMNTTLHKDSIISTVEYFEEIYKNELPRSSQGRPDHLKKVIFPMEAWLDEVNSLKMYAKLRPKVMWQHLEDALNLDGTFILSIQNDSSRIDINENNPISGKYCGRYFKNLPLFITALDHDSLIFDGWSDGDSNRLKSVYFDGDSLTLHPLYKKIIPPVDEIALEEPKPIQKKIEPELLLYLGYGLLALGFLLLLLYLVLLMKKP